MYEPAADEAENNDAVLTVIYSEIACNTFSRCAEVVMDWQLDKGLISRYQSD